MSEDRLNSRADVGSPWPDTALPSIANSALAFLFAVPLLTIALLVFAFFEEEPYPTLLMPAFAEATSVESDLLVDRGVLVVESFSGEARTITALEFASIDFGQSQAVPIMSGIIAQAPDMSQELNQWIHHRVAELVSVTRCGANLSLRNQQVRVNSEDRSLEIVGSQLLHDFGGLICEES